MIPKEKAKKLFDKMYGVTDYQAKQCALIAINEILFALKYDMNEPTSGSIKYWIEVKQEIEQL